jgi:hypothetical protein
VIFGIALSELPKIHIVGNPIFCMEMGSLEQLRRTTRFPEAAEVAV